MTLRPATSRMRPGHLSILRAANSDLGYRPTLQADDLRMLSQLYGENCECSDDFRLIQP